VGLQTLSSNTPYDIYDKNEPKSLETLTNVMTFMQLLIHFLPCSLYLFQIDHFFIILAHSVLIDVFLGVENDFDHFIELFTFNLVLVLFVPH